MNINEATIEDLEKIPGIGRDKAQDIINYREENGNFESWEDLKNIPGFSDELVKNLKEGGIEVG